MSKPDQKSKVPAPKEADRPKAGSVAEAAEKSAAVTAARAAARRGKEN